ncbi:MAG: DNA primase [Candidatus Delongbacteria bacterium]
MIPKEQIEKLRNSIDIVDVIGQRIDIKRSGANYKARCPFHDEKTPSFMVSQSKQIFKCFGCGVSGDPIKFIMMYDNLSYPDAIRSLASGYGVEIVEEHSNIAYDKSADDKKELFKNLNRSACEIFCKNLLKEIKDKNSRVSKYLSLRKIDQEMIKKFKLGYAADEWNFLNKYPEFSDHNDDLLIEAGLRKKNEKGHIYDQFRNRLIFPLSDQIGNVLAFSARAFDDDMQPKYLNSPETLLYKKNEVLYGLYQSLDTIRRSRRIILVEGNIDVITMHKFDITNTVAICGTSFTPNHARLIKRNADRVTILLDGDDAGKKSALKTAELLAEASMAPEIVVLPENSDPDSFLHSKGREEMEKILTHPVDMIELNIMISSSSEETVNDKAFIARSVIASLDHVKDPVLLDLYKKKAAERTGLSPEVIQREISKMPERRRVGTVKHAGNNTAYSFDPEDSTEFGIIYLMLTSADVRKIFLNQLIENDFKNSEASHLFLKIYELYEEGEEIKLNNILVDFDEKFKEFIIGFFIEQDEAFYGSESGSKSDPENEEKIQKAYRDSIRKMKLRKIAGKMENLMSELRYTKGSEEQNEILRKLSVLKKEQGELINGKT